jgi:putative ABC transport system permease protein
MARVPLAWKNLTHDPRRLLLAVGGIGFAVLLMCMQLGFRFALFDSTIELIQKLNADLVILHSTVYTVSVTEPFSRRRIVEALNCPGVESAYPLYIEDRASLWKVPGSGTGLPIRVLAFDLEHPVLLLPGLNEHLVDLQRANTVLFDSKSKSDYGDCQAGMRAELSGKSIEVVGQFTLGTDFAYDANLIMSDRNFRTYCVPPMPGDDGLMGAGLGLIKVTPGYDRNEVCERLKTLLGKDVKVVTREQLIADELEFWRQSTPIGFVFGLGAAMGFVVGVVICYQILYSDIADYIAEYATLKAMGYPNRFFVGVVLQEAILISILGFIPGVLVSFAMYTALGAATGLLLRLTLLRACFILLLTVGMCVFSGFLTLRKLLSADPAELFS